MTNRPYLVSLSLMLQRLIQELKEGKTFLQFGILKAVGQVLGMVAPLVVAKFFSEELFGSYSLAKMIVFFFSMLFVTSLQAPFIVFANQEKAQSGQINKTFTILGLLFLISLVIFGLFGVFFAGPIAAFAKISKTDVPFLVWAFIGLSLKSFICNLFMGLGQRVKHSAAEFVFGLICIILIFVLYFAGMINLRTVFLIYPVSAVLLVLMFAWRINYSQLFPLKLDIKHLFGILDFSKWQFLGMTAVFFINWGANLVFRYYGTSFSDIGDFNLGFSFFKGFVTLIGVIGFYFLPFISANITAPGKIGDYLSRKRARILVLGTACIILLYFVMPVCLRAIYADSYSNSDMVLRILLLGMVFVLYGVFYFPLFNALKLYKPLQLINIAHVTITFVLTLAMVPGLGLKGAAIAASVGYMLRALVLELYFRKKVKKMLA